MSKPDSFEIRWWNRRDDEADEDMARLLTITRLAAFCDVPTLDARTIERILLNDASVCGARNASAFATLRGMLQQHHRKVRKPVFDRLNEAATTLIVEAIVEGLRMPGTKAVRGGEA